MKSIKKPLIYVLCAVLLSCSILSIQPESKADAFAPAVALMFLIPILAAGAGYSLINYNNQNWDALQNDCSNIFSDITNYAEALRDGRVFNGNIASSDVDAWLTADSWLASGSQNITTGMMTAMARLFSDLANDRYNEEARTMQVSDAQTLDEFIAECNTSAVGNDKLSSFFNDCVARDNPTFMVDCVVDYYYDSKPNIAKYKCTFHYIGYPALNNNGPALSPTSFSFSNPASSWDTLTYSTSSGSNLSGFNYYSHCSTNYSSDYYGYGSISSGAYKSTYYDIKSINIYSLDFGDYVDGRFVGHTVASTGQYQAIDRTWANDYGVNSRDDAIDDTTAIAIPNVGTIEDLLAALGEVVTVDEMQAIIDKAIADAIAGSIDVPGETTDESTGESDKPVVVPGELGDYVVPSVISEIFPFCIPFDLVKAVKVLSAPGEAPVWEIPLRVQRLNIDYTFVIDMSEFESLAVIFRAMMVLLFILALILVTRNLIKG